MAESSVQVPVSLIEAIRKEAHPYTCDSHNMYGIPAHWGACDCWHAELAALLSQPTPTAEPCLACGGRGRTEDGTEFGQQCERCRGTGDDAAPPSIADMAPGTTFEYPERWTVALSQTPGWEYAYSGNRTRYLDQFDPSTIRDVKAPE